LQCPMACPGLVTHALAGFCVLWLPSAPSSSSGNLHIPANPQPKPTTCAALPQLPVKAPPNLLSTAEDALGHKVSHGMPRAGYSHTGRALCAVLAGCCVLLWKPPQTTCPHPPVQAPIHLLGTAEAASTLQCPMARPGLATHTLAGVCALCLPSAASSSSGNFHRPAKPQPHKPPAKPCRSLQCRLHHTCSALQRLHLTLQCPMVCPGQATHTLAGFCALWLPSAASSFS